MYDLTAGFGVPAIKDASNNTSLCVNLQTE